MISTDTLKKMAIELDIPSPVQIAIGSLPDEVNADEFSHNLFLVKKLLRKTFNEDWINDKK